MRVKKLLSPIYVMIHPFQGFDDLKWKKSGSITASMIILVMLFVSEIINRQLKAFPFNPFRVDRLNVFMVFAQTIIPFLLFVVANWCLCSLIDGEGKFYEIWVASSYAMLPIIIITVFVAFITNIITGDEVAFIKMMEVLRQIWFVFLLIWAMKTVHQFTLKKTLLSMAGTVAGMGIILFLIVLVFSLFQQIYIFILTLYNEILFRL